ncbi:hypothetical protein AX15_007082 [Amanita polypyramis BW_CC]|nr:hypothetical protein AX15_007082 [Amanita polypyramis BW_CC]
MFPASLGGVERTRSGAMSPPTTLDNPQDAHEAPGVFPISRTSDGAEQPSASLLSDSPAMPPVNQGKTELAGEPDANVSSKEIHQDKESGKPESSSFSSTLSGNKTHSGPTPADASTTLRSLATSNGNGNPGVRDARKAPRPSFLSRLIHLLIPCVSPSRAHLDDILVPTLPSPPGVVNEDTPKKYEENKIPSSISQPQAASAVEPNTTVNDPNDVLSLTPSPLQSNVEPLADDALQPLVDNELSATPDLENVMSGGVQPPGSSAVLDQSRGQDSNQNGIGEESEGSSFTEDEDLDDMNGMDEVDDEEDRLVLNGGTGIPIGPDGVPRPLLPPVAPQHAGRKCLILDLDETLVHSSFKSIQQADYVVPVEIEYHWHNVYVIKRPGVDNFLKKMGEIYEIVVFTASLSKYADPVLDKLDIHRVVSHRLFRESCYNHKGNYVKDLSQLGRPISDTIILDNSPASYIFHPNNAVPVSSWFNDPHDTELTDLVPFLADLGVVEDVRGVLDGAR